MASSLLTTSKLNWGLHSDGSLRVSYGSYAQSTWMFDFGFLMSSVSQTFWLVALAEAKTCSPR